MPKSIHIAGTPKGETPQLDERQTDRLLALGLTERDLAFMGKRQQEMVVSVLRREAS